uniref:Immunoglobulin like and fibronectin type III domain containing 1, tandem duplicate 3 n=1 Tax=Cyclopterus lumpus TaxID=8103 RepID=A0A8C2WKF4_CYCLU
MSIWWEKAIFSFNTASPGIHLTFLTSTPGVMITQYVVSIPEGKSAPDFLSKPIPLTIKEGKVAIFKVVVTGDPKPEVSWRRAKGPTTDKDKFQIKYDDSTGEHILEIIKVSGEESDTYKCSAANEYGKAVCTTTLNVDEGESKIYKFQSSFLSGPKNIFQHLLDIFSKGQEKAGGETDERFWDKMLNADKKDYKRICTEFGVADLDLILKKLDEKKKKERAQNKCKYPLCTWQDGAMSYDEDGTENHGLASAGRTTNSNIKGLIFVLPNEYTAHGLLCVAFTVSGVDFVIKIQELTAEERQDALFACVLTHPLPTITWMGKGRALAEGEKYSITVSEHKLIHRLLIKDCDLLDKGIYSAVAGDASCSAWLDVQGNTQRYNAPITNLSACAEVILIAALSRSYDFHKYTVNYIYCFCFRELSTKQYTLNHCKTGLLPEPNCSLSRVRVCVCVCVCVLDPGVHFICGLSDVSAVINETAEFTCKLSSEDCEGAWFRDGKKVSREDPPRFDHEDLQAFTEPVTVKVGHNVIFKLNFVGNEPIKIRWYREGEELLDDNNTKIEKSASHSRLLLSRCQRKDTGEIKIKLKNEHGFIEAISQLIVLDKPTPPLGPAEVIESSAICIEFRWRPPKDDGGSPVINYMVERQQVGRNTWKKIGEIPGVPSYRDTDVDHGRKYCYRIRAVTAEGTSEVMETDEMPAGTLAFPGPPAPPMVVSSYDDCINVSWASPSKTGGSRILGYILEKRKRGSNLWTVVNAMDEIIKEKKYAVKDVVSRMEYEFRVTAINLSGLGEFSSPSEFVFARDPKMRPKFTNNKMKSFMVVRAGNSVRITVNFEASPRPHIMWVKDNVPVAKRVTISNSDGSSQLLIPSSERSDSGIYSILVKNLAGQETFSTEVRVTDDPKPPGPVELEENVPGTVTVIWEPSPDEKRDDRLNYTVSKLDSTKRTWTTVAEKLFNNKFTVCNIMQGREYHFRVYAKNDMGVSAPSESPICATEKKKGAVPLKLHTAPKGYECYMSCAVKGNPRPRITWYRNHISLNTNTNYYISNTCGVCSMSILRVGPKDTGEYTISAENALGRAECSTVLSVRGERETLLHFNSNDGWNVKNQMHYAESISSVFHTE